MEKFSRVKALVDLDAVSAYNYQKLCIKILNQAQR